MCVLFLSLFLFYVFFFLVKVVFCFFNFFILSFCFYSFYSVVLVVKPSLLYFYLLREKERERKSDNSHFTRTILSVTWLVSCLIRLSLSNLYSFFFHFFSYDPHTHNNKNEKKKLGLLTTTTTSCNTIKNIKIQERIKKKTKKKRSKI